MVNNACQLTLEIRAERSGADRPSYVLAYNIGNAMVM